MVELDSFGMSAESKVGREVPWHQRSIEALPTVLVNGGGRQRGADPISRLVPQEIKKPADQDLAVPSQSATSPLTPS